ncbi:MarR family transcriptional regulator [Myxococcota bacterium]|nr:MarR family transcriptional regulator [Myxococcota bacterium]
MEDSRLLQSVQRLAGALSRMERQAAIDGGVSVPQLRVLLSLGSAGMDGDIRISDLAMQQGVAVSTMTRNLALLERKGWILRIQGSVDRRTVSVRLTEEGRLVSTRLQGTSVGRFSKAFDAFEPSDRAVQAKTLDGVAAALEKAEK